MHFDLLFEWILNWVKVTPPLGGLGLQQRSLILLMMIHVIQNITVKPICPYIGVVVFSIIIHNIKTIPEVSMHLCKFWVKVTPFYGTLLEKSFKDHNFSYMYAYSNIWTDYKVLVQTWPISLISFRGHSLIMYAAVVTIWNFISKSITP